MALKDHIVWNETTTSPSTFCKQKYGWFGVSKEIVNLSLLVLPQSQICRRDCCDRKEYNSTELYVAHGTIVHTSTGGTEQLRKVFGKNGYALKKGVWFLRTDWKENTGATGCDWLKQISNLH